MYTNYRLGRYRSYQQGPEENLDEFIRDTESDHDREPNTTASESYRNYNTISI